jgi:signal transduction histidine kinase/CheY-like chemotaxis protein
VRGMISQQPWTVLVIDDNPDDRAIYRFHLLRDPQHTYQILEAESGKEGLALCCQQVPDVILLDFQLPDMDGLEVLSEVQKQLGRTESPVVMLTGQGNEEIAVAAMKGGAADYLNKRQVTRDRLQQVVRNTIERARLKSQLKASERQFRTSVDNMLDCFGIYRSLRDDSGQIVDFVVEYVNAAACVSTGISAPEQMGKSLQMLLPSYPVTALAIQETLFEECCQVVETGIPLIKEVLIYENHHLSPSFIKAFDLRVSCLEDGFVASWHDITERRAMEQMKSEFISVVSHELRTPLASIRGALGLLAAGVLDDETHVNKQMLGIAAHETERLVRLVNDILDLERFETSKFTLDKQWCDATTLMQQVAEVIKPLTEESKITVSLLPDAQTVPVWADPDRLIQVLVNLLGNAIKFSPAESKVTLTAQAETDQVLFQVKDQGRGIPADKVEVIFGQFQQVDASDARDKGGTGLGLTICRNIIQKHGGRIWVKSILGEGSTFYFTLPIPLEEEILYPLSATATD